MSLITLPSKFKPANCLPELLVNQRASSSPYGGSEQVVDLLNDRWKFSCELPPEITANAAWLEAFINSMRGMSNWVPLWHFGRPNVAGTIAGAKTLSANAAQGASSISINATTGTTLLAGDMIGVSGLLLQVQDDATAAGGVMAVNLNNRLRTALSSGAAVTTLKPTANFRLMSNSGVRYMPGYAQGVTLDFLEKI